jgi:hypothetical protein
LVITPKTLCVITQKNFGKQQIPNLYRQAKNNKYTDIPGFAPFFTFLSTFTLIDCQKFKLRPTIGETLA